MAVKCLIGCLAIVDSSLSLFPFSIFPRFNLKPQNKTKDQEEPSASSHSSYLISHPVWLLPLITAVWLHERKQKASPLRLFRNLDEFSTLILSWLLLTRRSHAQFSLRFGPQISTLQLNSSRPLLAHEITREMILIDCNFVLCNPVVLCKRRSRKARLKGQRRIRIWFPRQTRVHGFMSHGSEVW